MNYFSYSSVPTYGLPNQFPSVMPSFLPSGVAPFGGLPNHTLLLGGLPSSSKHEPDLRARNIALEDEVRKLKAKLLWCEEERLRSLGNPRALHVNIQKDLSFEDQVLSLGALGSVDEFKESMLQLKFQFDAENEAFKNEDYFTQFLPHIKEDIRFEVSKRIREIDPKARGIRAKVLGTQKDTTKSSQGSFDYRQTVLRCTTAAHEFPRLDHYFSKELICIRLRSLDRSKLSFVLAIAENVYEDADEDDAGDGHAAGRRTHQRAREFTVRLLQHDLVRVENMFAATGEQSFEWDWLHGLIPAFRMHLACKHQHTPPFFGSIFEKSPQPWPEYQTVTEELTCPGTQQLNDQQLSVVERISQTTRSGLHFLIGPPGTGKTTTIVSLLLERVRKFPEEKILLTAPSNKAVQVVLQKMLNLTAADRAALPMVAMTGVMKDVPPELEEIYVGKYKYHLIKPFLDILHGKMALADKQNALKDAHYLVISRLGRLINSPGLVVDDADAEQRVLDLHAFAKKLSTKEPAIARKYADMAALHTHINDVVETIKQTRDSLEIYALQKSHIVFVTLVSSGRHNLVKYVPHFNTVLVDEASQALIPEVFITFKFHPKLMLLIGDPQQLPASVSSPECTLRGFADSLMLVMTKGAQRPQVEMLTTQYRMDPSICKWTSDRFYGGELVTGDSVLQRGSLLDALPTTFALQKLPSAFVDVHASEVNNGSGFIINPEEAYLIVQTVRYLLVCGVQPEQIGVITFYAAQVALLKTELLKIGVPLDRLAVSTVDGFQGDEKDFILVSCVRTVPIAGFLKDHRRINVALSRSKHARWVFGSSRALGHQDSPTALRDLLEWTALPHKNDTTLPTRVVAGEHVWQTMWLL